MTDATQISKILKEAMKSGKYSLGAKEISRSVKGSKAIIFTKSVPEQLGARIRSEATKHEVPVIDLNATSSEFARMIGRPFRVSVIALRSIGEGDLKQLQR